MSLGGGFTAPEDGSESKQDAFRLSLRRVQDTDVWASQSPLLDLQSGSKCLSEPGPPSISCLGRMLDDDPL